MKIIDKIALVTGGSRGLGRNTALQLAANGADVIVTYRQKKVEAEETAAEIQKLGRKAGVLQLDVAAVPTFGGFAESLAALLKETW